MSSVKLAWWRYRLRKLSRQALLVVTQLMGLSSSSLNEGRPRQIFLNEPKFNETHPNNKVTNTKYTLWTFLPKNLFLQLSRFMNMYFLVIAILQSFSVLSPVSPITIWLPLAFIFMVSAVKEALDDIARYKADSKANSRPYSLLRRGDFEAVRSEDIHVGDLVVLKEDEEVPCDLLLLKSADESGECYIQTANLDGESDFKSRKCVHRTSSMNHDELCAMEGSIECEPPNATLSTFEGRLTLLMSGGSAAPPDADGIALLGEDANPTKVVSLNASNIALQACVLRNTKWVIGLAVYTGQDTKFCQNKREAPSKTTKLDGLIDKMTLGVFLLQFALVVALGIVGYSVNKDNLEWYLDDPQGASLLNLVIYAIRFLLLLSLMIPISLKVTMDVVKFVNAKFIDWDRAMYDDQTASPARALNTSISEGLGQIEHVFCDKTGTLTQNVMTVKELSIMGHVYELAEKDLDFEIKSGKASPAVFDFLRVLGLCHAVIPSFEHIENFDEIVWKSPSPDEEALVQAAADNGVLFMKRTRKELELIVNGKKEIYKLIHTLEFSSDRRRMSVLVQNKATSKHYLFTKGADDVIFERTRRHGDKADKTIATLKAEVEMFSRKGLRTLMIAMKELSEVQVKSIKQKFGTVNQQIQNRQQLLNDLYESIEVDLELLGIAAINDQLQDEVPETIAMLRAAGLKIWMLTGDKMSTARQIALSCNLISPDELPSVVTVDDGGGDFVAYFTRLAQDTLRSTPEPILVISGTNVSKALRNCQAEFLELTANAKTVICCRVTPQQKSDVVRAVKQSGKYTLSIGDGGNDVAMIQEADVGVGISGREGLQAARAADFSFSSFRFLQRLMLVHGYYAYHRIAFVGHFCLQKALFIAFMQIMFALYTKFSGSSFFNGLTLATYNTFFTALPIMFYAVDKNIDVPLLLRHPRLYAESRLGLFFNYKTILYWGVRALVQSALTFQLVALFFGEHIDIGGEIFDQTALSFVAFVVAVTVQTFTVLFESGGITILNALASGLTYFGFFGFIWITNLIPAFGFYKSVNVLYLSPYFWLTVLLVSLATVLPVIFERSWRFNFAPFEYQKVLANQSTYESVAFDRTSMRDLASIAQADELVESLDRSDGAAAHASAHFHSARNQDVASI